MAFSVLGFQCSKVEHSHCQGIRPQPRLFGRCRSVQHHPETLRPHLQFHMGPMKHQKTSRNKEYMHVVEPAADKQHSPCQSTAVSIQPSARARIINYPGAVQPATKPQQLVRAEVINSASGSWKQLYIVFVVALYRQPMCSVMGIATSKFGPRTGLLPKTLAAQTLGYNEFPMGVNRVLPVVDLLIVTKELQHIAKITKPLSRRRRSSNVIANLGWQFLTSYSYGTLHQYNFVSSVWGCGNGRGDFIVNLGTSLSNLSLSPPGP